jgi:hypothetical protein
MPACFFRKYPRTGQVSVKELHRCGVVGGYSYVLRSAGFGGVFQGEAYVVDGFAYFPF